MNLCVIAIDPGLSGAVARLVDGVDLTVRGDFKRHKDIVESVRTLCEMTPFPDMAVIELVGARPGQGVCSMFSFGESTGVAYGAVVAFMPTEALERIERPAPLRWQNRIKRLLPADMTYDPCVAASYLFPKHAGLFYGPRGGEKDGNADAALLALYGHHLKLGTWKD